MTKLTDLNGAREALNICDVCHGIGWYAEQVSYAQQEQRRCENCNGEQDGFLDLNLEVDAEFLAKILSDCASENGFDYSTHGINVLSECIATNITKWARLVRK